MQSTESESRARILLVDDEPENLKAIERTLRNRYDMVMCNSAVEALDELSRGEFAVVISDQRMPAMLGTDLLAKVAQSHPVTTRIILTAFTDAKEILDAINRAEIYRYVTKPWDNQELLITLQQAVEHHRLVSQNRKLIAELEAKNQNLLEKERELTAANRNLESAVEMRTRELRIANEKLSELAMTDPLTKVLNRRSFFIKFNEELERSKRYRHTITLAIIDIDHFKEFNDMEGHVCGDEALRKVAQLFTSSLRKTDVLCRYGGEEFLIMMPETRVQIGAEICERLRASVEATVFQGQKTDAYITVCMGVAGYPVHGETSEDLLKSADHALYEAKEAGRNKVVTENS